MAQSLVGDKNPVLFEQSGGLCVNALQGRADGDEQAGRQLVVLLGQRQEEAPEKAL